VLLVSPITQGCSTVGKLHTQFGLEAGANHGVDWYHYSSTRAVAELGYVSGGLKTDTPPWAFGGTAYLSIAEDLRPGVKAIARRHFNRDTSLDLSAGPMITYDSSSLFNGFIGGVALNFHFITLRSEYLTWPVEPWEQLYSDSNGQVVTVENPGGHEKVWFNGVSFNGTGSWVAAAVAVGVIIVAGAGGAFD
jgi:hypothetical protein